MANEKEIERPKKRIRPATTPEGREKQLISYAVDLAEEQLRNGTASSQVISHFLKLGSSREQKEQGILEKQSELLAAKTEAMKSAKKSEEVYTKALKAMQRYSGQPVDEDEEYD